MTQKGELERSSVKYIHVLMYVHVRMYAFGPVESLSTPSMVINVPKDADGLFLWVGAFA